jgi:hypothetical protein
MRRVLAIAITSVALVGATIVIEPLAGASTLKPGVPTSVTSKPVMHATFPLQTGNVTVAWKAPKVVKGHTVKATSYLVTCGARKVTTTKTAVTIKGVATAPKTVTCTVVARAGKTSSATAKAKAVTVYTARGAMIFDGVTGTTFTGTAPTIAFSSTAVLTLADDPYTTNANSLGSYGTLSFNGGKLTKLVATSDPAGTDANPVVDVTGVNGLGNVINIGTATNLDVNTGMFTLNAPTDQPSIDWFAAQGLTFTTPGQAYGQFAVVGQSDL